MVATTLPAVVRVVDLPVGTTVTGAELVEAVQTTAGVGVSVQLSLNQIATSLGIPSGGATGTILNKSSGSNYSTQFSAINTFVNVGTSLATTGVATSIVAFVANQGITSTQIANNAVGTNQVASSLGIASSLSIGTILTVTGTAIFNGTTFYNATSIFNNGLQVTGTSQFTGAFNVAGASVVTGNLGVIGTTLITGTFGQVGTSLMTGTFGVVGTAQFTSGLFNIAGTTNVTGFLSVVGTASFTGGTFGVNATSNFTGIHGVVGTTLFTSGAFGVVGTSLFTGVFGQVGTSLLTGQFGVSGTTLHTGLFTVVGTAIFTGGFNFNVIGTTQFTSGAFNVNGTTLFTSGTFGVAGTTLFTSAAFGVVGTSQFTSNAFGIVGTATLTGSLILASQSSGVANFLQVSATGVVGTAAAAGNFVLLNTLQPNIVASTNDTSSFTNTYKNYLVTLENLVPATNVATTIFQVTVATSGSNFISGSYIYQFLILNNGTTIVTSGTSALVLTNQGIGTGLSYGVSGSIRVFNPASSVSRKQMVYDASYSGSNSGSTTTLVKIDGSGWYDGTTSPVTGINFLFNNTNIQTGTIKIYGLT